MRWTGHQLLLLWSRPCVPHYVLWGMHLGRTTGLRGEYCHNLQNTAHCPLSQYSNCASSNGDRIYQPIFWAVQNNLNGWPASKMLVSLRHTQQGWVGSYEKISSIKTIILGTIMATKASATFIICQVLPSTPLIRPAIATLAELAGRMAAVCQHHYWPVACSVTAVTPNCQVPAKCDIWRLVS